MAEQTIKIGDLDVRMTAVASANFYYRRVFDEDPFVIQAQAAQGDNAGGLSITFAMQMGYIMKMIAECNNERSVILKAISLDDYLIWLDQFSGYDFAAAAGDILTLYMSQGKTHSAEKKQDT